MTGRPSKAGRRVLLAVLGILALCVAGIVVAGRAPWSADATTQAPAANAAARRAVPVVVATVDRHDVSRIESAVGTVQAASTVQIKSRVDGEILQALFNEGQMVAKGDLLFRLDPKPFQAALDQARAVLARDQAQEASAKADLGRYGSLSKEGFASAQQFDQAQAQAKALAGTVAADKAAVEIARLNLGYTEIRSPIDGKTGAILVHPGNLVKATTDTLVVIAEVHPVRVSFSLPQQDLPKLQQLMAGPGIDVTISVPGDSRPPITARVDFIDNQVNDATGTIALRATVDNHDGRLVPGQFVNVAVKVARFPNALTVPRDAVNTGQNGTYVYVVKPDKTVEARPVKLAYQTDTMSVIASGVSAGETVVTDGQLRLAPGMKVTEVPAAQAPTAAPDQGMTQAPPS